MLSRPEQSRRASGQLRQGSVFQPPGSRSSLYIAADGPSWRPRYPRFSLSLQRDRRSRPRRQCGDIHMLFQFTSADGNPHCQFAAGVRSNTRRPRFFTRKVEQESATPQQIYHHVGRTGASITQPLCVRKWRQPPNGGQASETLSSRASSRLSPEVCSEKSLQS